MSVAFRRESDEEHLEPKFEIPIPPGPNLVTARGLALILDETYRDFDSRDGRPHDLFTDPDWDDVLIHLYSFSKAYCVPGHRVAAIAGGGAFRAALMKALDTMQICAPRAAP